MQALFSLNSTSAHIWRLCENGPPLEDVISQLAKNFHLPMVDARRYVELALEEWRHCGLLEGSLRVPASSADLQSPESEIAEVPNAIAARSTWECRRYAVLDTLVDISWETAGQAERVFAVVGHLEVAADAARLGTGADCVIDIVGDGQAQNVFVDGRLVQRCESVAEIAPLIHWHVFSSSVREDRYILQLHTAAVECGGRALLLPGPSGVGKSTLSSALLEEHFGYLSDDMVVLDRESFCVRGLPFSICVKESGLEGHYDSAARNSSSQLHLRADGRQVHYRHPKADSLIVEPLAAGWVVFPRYDSEVTNEIRAISPAEALRRLLGLSAPPRHLRRDTAVSVLEWAASLRCCEIEYSDTQFAISAIRSFVTQN